MSQELLYTSAPRGLKAGSRGFCTVLSTQGMPAPLASALEGLSGYRPIFPPSDPNASSNPVAYSHLKVSVVGRTIHLLSRIADAGLDYSGRSNKLAHHLVPDDDELLPGGPANVLLTPGIVRDAWTGEPKIVAPKSVWSEQPPPSGICTAWKEMTGDAGWAGVLAEAFLADPERMVIVLFAPGQEVLPLFAESISLLPVKERWNVTFSTYFTGLAPAAKCLWRAMIHDSKEAHESLRFVKALRIDLTAASLPTAQGGALVEAARTGIRRPEPQRRSPPLPASAPAAAVSAAPVEDFASADSEPPVHFAGIPEPPIRLATVSSGPPPIRGAALRARRGTGEDDEESRPSRWRVVIPLGLALFVLAAVGVGIAFYGNRPHREDVAVAKEDAVKPPSKVDQAAAPTTKPIPPAVEKNSGNPGEQATGGSDVPPADALAASNSNAGAPLTKNTPTSSIPENNSTSNTSSPNPDPPKHAPVGTILPTGPKKPEIRKVELPTVGKPITLFEFDRAPGQPRPRLLKPRWLSFTEQKTSNGDIAVVDHGTAEDVFAVLQLGPIKENRHSIQLAARRDEKVKWLAWYVVQFDGAPPGSPDRFVAFMQLPLDQHKIDRKIGKGTIHWSLPSEAEMNSTSMPRFVLDRLQICIGSKRYTCSEAKPSDEWRLSLKEYEDDLCKRVGLMPFSDSRLKVDLKLESKEKLIQIAFSGYDSLHKHIEEEIGPKWDRTKTVLLNQLRSVIEPMLLTKLEVTKIRSDKNVIQAGLTALADIQKHLEKLKSENANRAKEVDDLIKSLMSVKMLLDHIAEFQQSKDDLKDAVVTAARIYYDVMTKDKSKNLVIDVVNFEDAVPSKTNQPEQRS